MPNFDQDLGWIKGMLNEHLLRMDRFEAKQTHIEEKLVELLGAMSNATSRDALVAGLIGACAGAITGAMVSAALVTYLVPIIVGVMK